MTLVVARIIEKQIVIISDTKVTSPTESLQGLDSHILKAIILNPNLCICYAQTIRKALRAIIDLGINLDAAFDLESIQDSLLQKHRNGNNDPDFIIASLLPIPALYKISNGRMMAVPAATWLGNVDAFNDYQTYYGTASKSPMFSANIANNMYFAFNNIISQRKYEDIGEFVMEVKNDSEGFKYFQYASGVSAIRLNARGVVSSIAHKTAGEGGYTFSVFAPKKAGIGAVGIHFYQGNLGVLFYPTKQEKPIRYLNVNIEQFKSKVQEEFGFEIVGDNIVSE